MLIPFVPKSCQRSVFKEARVGNYKTDVHVSGRGVELQHDQSNDPFKLLVFFM